MTLICVSVSAQKPIRICSANAESRASVQLHDWLERGGCKATYGGRNTGHTIYVGLPPAREAMYRSIIDTLRDGGYLIIGDGHDVVLCGAGEKGTLYAVYAYLEQLGYRMYTPDAVVIPDLAQLPQSSFFNFKIVENPAFAYREVAYYYPNQSQLYADWHHLHTQADRRSMFGMYVHTFAKLLPPERYFDAHPEWYSLNNGRRCRDGQLCLSNPAVFEALCARLADTMATAPQKKVWSVSPNDNYNACECADCRRLDSLYGGPSGTLVWFVNQVARRFPDKTISTLAYQYTRAAGTVRPEANVKVMLCPIEAGRQAPIEQSDPSFCKDIADWGLLTDNIYLWDYVVQFRNYWNPFPNLHVLQQNLQFFREHGVDMMFEQASGAENVTSWMDIRCYMLAKLLWDPYVDIDSVMADFYGGYYGEAGRYVKQIIDTMTVALVASGQVLNIYGFPIDGDYFDPDNPNVGYLYPTKMELYYDLMRKAMAATSDSTVMERLRFFRMALDFAHLELCYGDPSQDEVMAEIDRMEQELNHFGVPQMMEMGCSPTEYAADMRHWAGKAFGMNLAYGWNDSLRKQPTAPYNVGGLTDGDVGIMDYRHSWLGFWGDTLDVVVDLGGPHVLHEISIDFYCYPLSWIFLPQRVRIALSADGEQWHWLYTDRPLTPQVLALPEIYTCKLACNPIEGLPDADQRFVRVVAEPLPEIPAWHRAAGQKPWIFTDEIIVK